jgi:hypothetical protein
MPLSATFFGKHRRRVEQFTRRAFPHCSTLARNVSATGATTTKPLARKNQFPYLSELMAMIAWKAPVVIRSVQSVTPTVST